MVVIAVGNDGQFRALCVALGAPGMGSDPRFTTNAVRIENRATLTAELSALTAGHDMKALMALLEAAGVPCGPVNTVDQVFAEPQALHRGLEVEQTRADLSAPVRTVASPIRLSKTPVRYDRPPPALGADTEEVLGEVSSATATAGAT
jgi:crotonobetainyl-CoA:carnitine CoA-transferase CaiB-like acyl-CoA transferase